MKNFRVRLTATLGCFVLLATVVTGATALATPSQVATGLSVSAANQQVTVGFTQPDLTPTGSAPTVNDTRRGYQVNIYQNNVKIGSMDACAENSGSTIESCVVSSYITTGSVAAKLENGVAYTFKIIARWSIGENEEPSIESAASEASTPYTNPDKPSAPTAVVNSTTSTSADVAWVAPADNGESIDGYTVTVWNKLGSSAITSNSGCSTSALTCTVSNLTLGSAYTFKVVANNSAGDSPESDVSNAVTVVPGLPTSVSFTTGTDVAETRIITVSWAAPLVSDEAITEYTVTATAGTTVITKTWTSGLLETTFTADVSGSDLVLGTTYGVTVKAKNSGGYGQETSTQSVTPSDAPGAPTNPAATFSTTTATVTWTAPTSDGGEAISEYTAVAFASSATDTTGTSLGSCTSTGALTCQIVDLVPGTGYKFAVKAKNNSNDYGTYSSLTSTVTAPLPIAAPSAPRSVAASFDRTTATVTWVVPISNGGEAISEYTAVVFASSATDTTGTSLGSCTSTGALTCEIDDLVPGTGYKFAVKAKNGTAGYGVFSSLTSTVTAPVAAPTTTTTTTTTTLAPPVSTSTTVYVTPVPSTKLSAAYGTQVSVSRSPSTAVIAKVEVALSKRKVTMYVATPKSSNAKTAIVRYVIELRPTKGASVKKSVVVKSGQVIKPSLTGKAKTTYYVVIVAYQKSGRTVTWKGPKFTIK